MYRQFGASRWSRRVQAGQAIDVVLAGAIFYLSFLYIAAQHLA
jgi:hypothetical protein